jgi:hypothetical protein
MSRCVCALPRCYQRTAHSHGFYLVFLKDMQNSLIFPKLSGIIPEYQRNVWGMTRKIPKEV